MKERTAPLHVALIYDDMLRPETTGGYCLRALRRICHVVHYRPLQLDDVSGNEYDLFLQIDDGLDYRIPERLRPAAVWVIDTHMDFETALSKARAADFVFAAQKDGADKLCQRGVEAAWLPLGCDPAIHRPHDVPRRYDVCFVGNLFPGPRGDLLERITQRVPRTFVGRRYFDEMAETYSASKIVFNRSLKNDVNMRVFEALACGSLLLTNDLAGNGQHELFQDGVHLATYRNEIELFEKLQWLLKDGTARERIAAAGRAEVLRRHTYAHRMRHILQTASWQSGR